MFFYIKTSNYSCLQQERDKKKQAAQRGPPAMFVVKWKD